MAIVQLRYGITSRELLAATSVKRYSVACNVTLLASNIPKFLHYQY